MIVSIFITGFCVFLAFSFTRFTLRILLTGRSESRKAIAEKDLLRSLVSQHKVALNRALASCTNDFGGVDNKRWGGVSVKSFFEQSALNQSISPEPKLR